MGVSMRFTTGLLVVALTMSALSLGHTTSVAAEGLRRYVIVGANNTLPLGLDSLVAAAGGEIVQSVGEIGVAVAESAEPSFADAVAGINGVQGVAEDRVFVTAPPDDSAVVIEDAAGEGAVVEGGAIDTSKVRFFAAQWNLRALGADRAWDAGFAGSPSVKVAVIDSGIDYLHQELVGKVDLALSKSFVKETIPKGADGKAGLPFADLNRHGTHVAGIIAAKGVSVLGVAPRTSLIAVKVAGKSGETDFGTLAAGIVYAANVGADVINMSLGGALEKQGRDDAQLMAALNRAVNYAFGKGALLVASAGNGSIDWDSRICEETLPDRTTTFVNCPAGKLPSNMTLLNMMKVPAQLPHVIAVSATGPFLQIGFDSMALVPDSSCKVLSLLCAFSDYSDFGQSIVTLAAPGGSATWFRCQPDFPSPTGPMVSCTQVAPLPNGRPNPGTPSNPTMPADAILSACSSFAGCSIRANVFMIGTSMAAAHVSGTAALVQAATGLKGDALMQLLKQFADDLGKPGKDGFYGFGRVNADRAVTRK